MDVINHIISLLRVEDNKPFFKSSGIINFYINSTLESISQSFDRCSLGRNFNLTPQERLLPYDRVKIINFILNKKLPVDLFIYDDDTLAILPPSYNYSKRNWVFFHGIRGNPGQYLLNDNIDILITNSRYFGEILKSIMLANINEENQYNLNKNLNKIIPLALPVPLLDFPEGYDSQGSDLSKEVERLINSDHIIATSIQRDKPIPEALIFIGKYMVNFLGKVDKTLKIIISDKMKSELEITNHNLGDVFDDLTDVFVYVPVIKNKCLVRLMKRSSFTLCYFRYPESFGLYPLESILLNKPVYTNGIGNNRYLLPPDHGLFHIENVFMYKHKSQASYLEVSEMIFRNLFDSSIKSGCKKGIEYIISHYNSKIYAQKIKTLFNKGPKLSYTEDDHGYLVVVVSPLVRIISYDQRYIVTDYLDRTLSNKEIELLKKIAFQKLRVLDLDSSEKKIYFCFATEGILTQKYYYEL